MSRGRWFLPEEPDMIGLLRRHLAVTSEGVEAFVSWAGGDGAAAERLRRAESRGDAAKRELLDALRVAFVVPLEPEDLFTLSRGIDWILNYVRDLVTESEVMGVAPDPTLAEMAAQLAEAVDRIDDAIRLVDSDEQGATDAAEAAIRAERGLEATYYRGMASLLAVEDRQERIARRELYRRTVRIGEVVIDVAERIIYAVVKES